MTGIIDVLEALPLLVILALAVLLVMGETGVIVGLFFPVEITLLFVGFLAYLGQVPLGVAFVLMVAAAMTGDALALRSGRKYGPRVRSSWVGARIGPDRWQRADRILHRLGGRAAFVARWVPFVRTLLPRIAGSAGLPYRRYVGWNAAGAVTAVGSSVLLGYFAGASYQRVADLLGRATAAVLLLALVLIAIGLVGRWLGHHPDPVRALASWVGHLPPMAWLRRWGGRLAGRVGGGWAFVINLLAGLVLLCGLGFGLSWLVQLTVDQSGLSGVDAAVERWLARHRTPPTLRIADLIVTATRGLAVVAVVAVVAVLLAWRHRVARRDLLGVVGTAGAFMPLLVLAVAAGLAGGEWDTELGGLSIDATVATAGVGTLTWLFTRGARWLPAVAGWTAAAVAVVILMAGRLYSGLSTASGAVNALLLGGLWVSIFMIAWATRAGSSAPPARADPGSQRPALSGT